MMQTLQHKDMLIEVKPTIILLLLGLCLSTTAISQSLDFEMAINEINCDVDGSIEVTISGGIAPYTIEWIGPERGIISLPENTIKIPVKVAGTYSIEVRDNQDSRETKNTIVRSINNLTFDSYGCRSNDSLQLQILNGLSPYKIDWSSNGATVTTYNTDFPTLFNLSSGNEDFQITIEDALGCDLTKEIDIVDVALTITPTSCNLNNGTIEVSITNYNLSNYTISWSGPVSDTIGAESEFFTIPNLPAGSYEVKVMDEFSDRCFASETIQIEGNNNDILSTTLKVADSICREPRSVEITVSGGSPDYTIDLMGSAGTITTMNNIFTISELISGTYSITVIDAQGCYTTQVVTIDTDCDRIDEDGDGFTDDVDCDDNNPNINPGVAETPNSGFDENCDGISLIIDNDNDGYNSSIDCDDNNPNINPGVAETPNSGFDENCDGISLIIDEDQDGYNSSIDCDDSNPTVNGNGVEIPNNGIDEDCDGMDLVTDMLDLEIISQDIICDTDGFIKIRIKEGASPYTIEWSGPISDIKLVEEDAFEISITDAGYYTVTTTDSQSASISETIIIRETNNDLNFELFGCIKNDSLQLEIMNGTPPYQISWTSDGAISIYDTIFPILTNLPNESENLDITVTDALGCNLTKSIEIFVLPSPSFNTDINEKTVTFTNTSSIGNSIWNFGDSSTSNETNPVHTYETQDTFIVCLEVANECGKDSSCQQITISSDACILPSFKILGDDDPLCNGQSTEITTAKDYDKYWWSNGDTIETITIYGPGTYMVTVLDEDGCEGQSEAFIIDNKVPFEIEGNQKVCKDSTTLLTLSKEFIKTVWSTEETTPSILVGAGKYTVTVTSEDGCEGIEQITVTELPPIDVLIEGDSIICEGETTELKINSEFEEYIWETGETTSSISVGAGNYTVTVTSKDGCTGVDRITVTELPPIEVSIAGDLIICEGATTTLEVSNNFSAYNWSTGDTTPIITIDTPGNYLVTVTDANSCSTISSPFGVAEQEVDFFTILENTTVCSNDKRILEIDKEFESYNWSTGDTTQAIAINEIGIYTVTVTNLNGCTGSITKVVTEEIEEVEIAKTICYDSHYMFGELLLTESGLYKDTLSSLNTCDTILILNLTVQEPPIIKEIYLCDGEVNEVGDTTIPSIITDCDSILVIVQKTSSPPAIVEEIDTTFCDEFSYRGFTFYKSVDTLIMLKNRCEFDSLMINFSLTKIAVEPTLIDTLLEKDETIEIDGISYGGPTLDTMIVIESEADCNSVVHLKIREELLISDCISENECCDNLLTIKEIEQFPRNTLTIINRWGDKVYEAKPYDNNNPWHGKHHKTQKSLPEGAYIYILETDVLERGHQTGYIYIIR